MADAKDTAKPDLKKGVPLDTLADGGMVVGVVDAEEVILARRGEEHFAIGALCTHYHAPLADGLIAGDTLRCPWHHACFSLRTGEALRAPALDPIAGGSKGWAVLFSCAKRSPHPDKGRGSPVRTARRPRSTSSAGVPPEWRPRTCCVAKVTGAG